MNPSLSAYPPSAGSKQKAGNHFFYFLEPEYRFTQALLDYDLVSHELAYLIMFGYRSDDQPVAKAVDVYIMWAKRKLGALGVEVKHQRGCGYFLNDDSREHLRRLLDWWSKCPIGVPVVKQIDRPPLDGQSLTEYRQQLADCVSRQRMRVPTLSLTGQEADVLTLLLHRSAVNSQAIKQALYGSRPDSDKPAGGNVYALISKLRKKLKLHDIVIGTGEDGWHLNADSKRTLAALMEAK